MMTWKEAKAAGSTRYFGKLCPKHPELNGERRTSGWNCVECARAKRKRSLRKYRKTSPEYKAKDVARVVAQNARRRKTDPLFNLKSRMRKRLRSALDGQSKSKSTEQVLGCTWEELRVHIERQFTDDMSWDNRHLWHVDHVIPLVEAETPEDIYRLSHYTNLQPLWAAENLAKGGKRHDS